MAKSKVVRTPLRSGRHIAPSSRSVPGKVFRKTVPPKPEGPISHDIEHQPEQLVAKFGEKKVLEALDPLVTKCKLNDWQCVDNAIRRIARDKRTAAYSARLEKTLN